VSKSVSPQKAITRFPPRWRISPRACKSNRGCRSELFGKLATGGLLRILRRADLALGNRPGAVVLVAPIGSAGMDEQHFDATSSSAIGQYAGTQVRP
jgi:hypothetical protein